MAPAECAELGLYNEARVHVLFTPIDDCIVCVTFEPIFEQFAKAATNVFHEHDGTDLRDFSNAMDKAIGGN